MCVLLSSFQYSSSKNGLQQRHIQRVMESLASMDVLEVGYWMKGKGFKQQVVNAFEDQEMYGEALQMALSSCPGPDCFKGVVPALGLRLKVYHAIKSAFQEEEESLIDKPTSPIQREDGASSEYYGSSPASSLMEFSQRPSVSFKSPGSGASSASTVPIKSPGSGASSESKPGTTPKSSRIKKSLPNPFPIPMFRKYTQNNLDKKKVADDDRRHIISVLGHVICAHLERASMRDCQLVAEALLRKYPFLSEAHSWQHFLYTKCQNINRTPGTKHVFDGSDAPKSKRSKTIDVNKHAYPGLDDMGNDDVSDKRNKALLDSELTKTRPQKDSLVDLMKRTSVSRRKWILNEDVKTVNSICLEWPLLKKFSFVVMEFITIMKKDEQFKEIFVSSWKKWGEAIVEYAKAIKSPPTGVQQALRQCDNKDLTSLRCWAHFLTAKKKGKDVVGTWVDTPFILWDKPRGTPPSECVDAANTQPFIVQLSDTSDDVPPQFFLVIEQELLVECSNLIESVLALFAAHYVFNIRYHPRLTDFYLFIEHKIANISPSCDKKSPTYLSVTSAAQCFLKEED